MTTVNIKIDPVDKILLKRNLNKNGKAQLFFSNEIRRFCDPYVPKLDGPLKDTAQVTADKVRYVTPYARRWYYAHKGNGLRGPKWDKRMWAARGPEIVRSVASFVGGKASG